MKQNVNTFDFGAVCAVVFFVCLGLALPVWCLFPSTCAGAVCVFGAVVSFLAGIVSDSLK